MTHEQHKEGMQSFLNLKIKELKNTGIENAANEIKWFLEENLCVKSDNLFLKKNFFVSDKQFKKLNEFINRRLNHEPFQYILKSATFYGYDLYVDKNVLIPRPESEVFIDVLKTKKRTFNSALDIGTGSGNLALAIALQKLSTKITAIDKSKAAIQIATKNFLKHKAQNINCYQADFFNINFNKKYDLVVSNPPYVSLDEYKKLSKTVKNFEPKSSLTDGSSGYTFYHKICEMIPNILNPQGLLLIEIGLEKHKMNIEKIFQKYSFQWHKDLQQNNRIIEIQT
tara:strand:- start:551 stop:1399 length:849 start_codon:yes stop_codon:yes gene_type:complete